MAAQVQFEPLFIIPLLQSLYITFGSTASGIFYEEFATLSTGPAGSATWAVFVASIGMIVAGILLLAPPSAFRGGTAKESESLVTP